MIIIQTWYMGSKQLGFGDYEQAIAKNLMKGEKFLMEKDVGAAVEAIQVLRARSAFPNKRVTF